MCSLSMGYGWMYALVGLEQLALPLLWRVGVGLLEVVLVGEGRV